MTVLAPDPPAQLRRPLQSLPGAGSRIEVLGSVLGASGLAWWWSAERMAGMNAGPGANPGALGWFTGVWAVMMAAMMLPSLAPMAAAVAATARRRDPRPWLGFVAGYLLVWAAAGLVAYSMFELGRGVLAYQLAWHRGGRWLAAATLAAAAAYELTPLKCRCLLRCKREISSPRSRRRTWMSSLALGLKNGSCCVGCSWALMAALFALGVMSLTWMAVIAGLVSVEKLGPSRRAVRSLSSVILLVLALGLATLPNDVPGLVVQGSPSANQAMNLMR